MSKLDVDQIISQCRGAFISISLHQSEANALCDEIEMLRATLIPTVNGASMAQSRARYIGEGYEAGWNAALRSLDKTIDTALSKLQTEDKPIEYWMGVGSAANAAVEAIKALQRESACDA